MTEDKPEWVVLDVTKWTASRLFGIQHTPCVSNYTGYPLMWSKYLTYCFVCKKDIPKDLITQRELLNT